MLYFLAILKNFITINIFIAKPLNPKPWKRKGLGSALAPQPCAALRPRAWRPEVNLIEGLGLRI